MHSFVSSDDKQFGTEIGCFPPDIVNSVEFCSLNLNRIDGNSDSLFDVVLTPSPDLDHYW